MHNHPFFTPAVIALALILNLLDHDPLFRTLLPSSPHSPSPDPKYLIIDIRTPHQQLPLYLSQLILRQLVLQIAMSTEILP